MKYCKPFFLAFLFCIALVTYQLSAQETSDSAAPSAQKTESVEAPPTENSVSGDQVDETLELEEEKDWEQKFDDVVGEWLVSPLASVLFFSVYDFPVLDDAGNPVLDEKGKPKVTSTPFVVVWLFLGSVFLTLRMGFVNIRLFPHAIRLVKGDYDHPDSDGEVTHFQALASALSATVGLGNIAGVAIAVGAGGPGATFWMIMAGAFGMTCKFAECTLAQKYRKVHPDGEVSGGPMRYLQDGLREWGNQFSAGMGNTMGSIGSVIAVIFAVLCVGASFGGGNTFQVVQSKGIVSEQLSFIGEYPIVYGLVMAFLVGLVIIGGIRKIAAAAEKIVPTMCGLYCLSAIVILLMNASEIGNAFATIFNSAFSADALYGGFIGVLVMGIKRASFSNEAGVGSAAIAHAAAKAERPVSEGVVALMGPFIDTIVVCTMTALVIVITGAYNDPATAEWIKANEGAKLTSWAFEQSIWFFPYILSVAVFLFAFSTIISWSYYGERCWTFLFGRRSSMIYKIIYLLCAVLGSIISATNILDFNDLMILTMSIPNLFGVFLMSGMIKRDLNAYVDDLNSGKIKPTVDH